MKLLAVIDMQNDFIDGALGTREAEQIVAAVKKKVNAYLEDQDINSHDPVKIDFGNESIWFTQTHIAEIRELMALKDAADEYVEPSTSSKQKKSELVKELKDDCEEDEAEVVASEFEEDAEAEVVVEGTDVYKEYIGKRVLHKSVGYGVVRTCDGKYLGIEFEEGPKAGKVTNYSLETCLSKGLIQIV